MSASAPPSRIKQLLARFDWQFIRGSSAIMIGITAARVLGFAFSFLLARALTTDDFGFVQYSITLATLVALLTVPFAEQVMPWFISRHKEDAAQLARVASSGAWLLLLICGLSLVIAVPVLAWLGRLSLPVIVIFLGVTLFNTYAGLGRGFLAPGRLLGAYLGSNALQMVAVIITIALLGAESSVPVLFIYGLSYVLPIVLLQVLRPFPLALRAEHVQREMMGQLVRFAAPVWASHALYTFTFALDILLLERFHSEADVGVYSLTKTIVMGFSFVSQGIAMTLMPKIAASDAGNHRRLLFTSIGVTLAVNCIALVGYFIIYPWFVPTLIGQPYFIGMTFGLLMAASAIIYSLHAILTSYLIGRKQPELETLSRTAILITMLVAGLWLIPSQGAVGAAWATVISASVGVLSYAVILGVRRVLRRGHA
jgi:O-antigen/teichoic acid export membrane protein